MSVGDRCASGSGCVPILGYPKSAFEKKKHMVFTLLLLFTHVPSEYAFRKMYMLCVKQNRLAAHAVLKKHTITSSAVF